MQYKSMLFLVNLCAGQKRVARKLPDIVQYFCDHGYMPTILATGYAGHARLVARDHAGEYDLVVCAGGDGTLNETVDGVLEAGVNVPIGYIPCGTTNDLASSLKLSRDLDQAARDILESNAMPLDIGSFNGRHFVYTASFGAFTNISYATPQSMKNALGHLAYVLEGVKNLGQLQPVFARIHTDAGDFSGEYIFGSVSNTTSIAGLVTLDSERVHLNDGKFELILVEAPRNAIDLSQIVLSIAQQKYEGLVRMVSVSHIEVETLTPLEWTLDGEYEKGGMRSVIDNLPNAVNIFTPQIAHDSVEEDEADLEENWEP